MALFHLYIDDSGTRLPDRVQAEVRADGMDYFALGGFLILQENIRDLVEAHRNLVDRWKLTGPLHSTKIRGRRKHFAWLGASPTAEQDFLGELEVMILNLPIIAISCVIDRPGYVARYADRYEQPWLLCKTAYSILIERAAKYAARLNGKLEVFFEQAGQKEDRAILSYARELRTIGMPFESNANAAYEGLSAEEFKYHIIGEPNRITKQVPMAQIADLVLYPMVKGGYDSNYRPYVRLMESERIIDAKLKPEQRSNLGVKYSCFDSKK